MSVLIDELIAINKNRNKDKINGKRYIAKPIELDDCLAKVICRIKNAYRVLIGKSYTYHYAEDDIREYII